MKNIIILLFIFWGFSAKAQKPNHTEIELDSSDVFGGFLESSQNLAVKMYQLVMDNKVKIYKDSLLKKELKGKEKNKYTTSLSTVCGTPPYHGGFIDLKDEMDTDYYDSYSDIQVIINKNTIDFYSFFQIHYYMPLDKTLALLNVQDKTILGIWTKSLNGNVNEKTIQNYTQNFLEEKLDRIYQLSINEGISTYKNDKLDIKYNTPEEVLELGCFYHIVIPVREDIYYLIDSVIATPISPKTLKGFKVIYHQKTDSNMQAQFQVTALGFLFKHDEDTSKGYKNLYYLKPEDVFGMFSKEEKLLWDAMIQFHIFKRFEEE